MKRILTPFITLLIALSLLAGCAGFPSAGASKKPTPTYDPNSPLTRVRIAVLPDLPPFSSYDGATQDVTGFDIDLMNAIAKKADFYVEYVVANVGYNYIVGQLAQCSLDGAISAMPVVDELKAQFDYSDPYYSTGQVLTVKLGNLKINGLENLQDMTVGAQVRTPSAQEVAKVASAQPRYYDSTFLAFQDLINGNIDSVIADHPRAWNYARVKANNLKIVGSEFGNIQYAIAFCKGKHDILEKINTALGELKSDGTLDKLIRDWRVGKYDQ